MVAVKSVKEFAQKNEKDLRAFSRYKTGINDTDILNDQIQDFYVRLIKSRALETYDESLGSFDSYIISLFCWTLLYLGKKNFRAQYRVISSVENKFMGEDSSDADIWNYVGARDAFLRIDRKYLNRCVSISEEYRIYECLQDFKKYIRRTESENYAYKMIYFLEHRKQGCRSKDIAGALGVSFAMVSRLKKRAFQKFLEWQSK